MVAQIYDAVSFVKNRVVGRIDCGVVPMSNTDDQDTIELSEFFLNGEEMFVERVSVNLGRDVQILRTS